MATRLSGPERKRSIIEAAQTLFAEKGFHGVSIDDICRKLAVSPAVLYRYFESKQAIYDAVLDRLSCKRESYVEAILQTGSTFEDVLQVMTRIFIESVLETPDLLKIELQSLLETNPASSAFFDSRWKSFSDVIYYGLDERLPVDQANREPAMIAAGVMFQGMLREALLQKCITQNGHLKNQSIDTLVSEMLSLFYRAVGINKVRHQRKAVIKP